MVRTKPGPTCVSLAKDLTMVMVSSLPGWDSQIVDQPRLAELGRDQEADRPVGGGGGNRRQGLGVARLEVVDHEPFLFDGATPIGERCRERAARGNAIRTGG